ncbi:hypothetical protein FQA39_LY14262 [Lamprigera yunnana]|nr:hypothetical protein FQA39_LY14262 [Lamprigera yunnana]
MWSTKSVDTLTPVLMATITYEVDVPPSEAHPPPIMIMHGLLGSKMNWNNVGRGLHSTTKPQRKVVVFDIRNHGDSPHANDHSYHHLTADINYYMNIKKIKKATFMGHSMGGRSVMFYSLLHPERVEKIIILDVSPINHPKENEFDQIESLLNILLAVDIPKNTSMTKVRKEVDKQLAKHAKESYLRQFLMTNLTEKEDGSIGWRVNLPVLIKNFSQNIRKFPNISGMQFNGPGLLLSGEKSNFLRSSDPENIKKIFPKMQFAEIKGAGHWLHAEKPKDVIMHCSKFLNS